MKKKLILGTLSTLLILITSFLIVNNTTEKKQDVYNSYHINFLKKKITFYTYETCDNGKVKVKKYSKHGLRTDIELYVECPFKNPFDLDNYIPGAEKLPNRDTIQLKALTPSINVYIVENKKKKYYKFKFQKPYLDDEEFKEYLKSFLTDKEIKKYFKSFEDLFPKEKEISLVSFSFIN